ncbi:MAG: hypothetical protein HY820_16685 [Acidobacteria bacterium]|nr:hypothetical protein [Acidobacteriota bacterium]
MTKKLILLNLLLLCALGVIGKQLLDMRRAALARKQAALEQKVKPAPAPPLTPVPVPAAVQAAGYLDVAQQTLFSKDRNPNIAVEPEKPKPVPTFPKLYGVMNLGDGPMAILSDGPGKQKTFRAGEKAGQLLLAEIGADALVFEFEKEKFTKKFTELQVKTEEAPAGGGDSRPAAAAAPATPPPTNIGKVGEPGRETGGGISACSDNDNSPAGTVSNGKRKVITESPFGKVCRWEPVR